MKIKGDGDAPMRPIDLARKAGLSTQAVRNYEQLGFLPPSPRSIHGYRLYGPQHLQALHTARLLREAFGWQHALQIMRAVHSTNLAVALAIIDERHATIHHNRVELEETIKMLRDLLDGSAGTLHEGKKLTRPLTIGEVAKRLGIHNSAIRFWEVQGLVQPLRDKESRYRLYGEKQLAKLQVLVLLRKGGYGIEAVRSVLTQLETGSPEHALKAAEERLQELSATSKRCMQATSALWAYIEEYCLPT